MWYLDVTPLSLGIETLGGIFTKIIERNTTIPTSKSQYLPLRLIISLQWMYMAGRKKMASGNVTLGRFQLSGIPPAPQGDTSD